MSRVETRLAIITGAARGIGAATALRLAKEGFTVLAADLEDGAELQGVVAEMTAAGGNGLAVAGDVADPGLFPALFDRAESLCGGVDVLVNNAGIMVRKPIAEIDDMEFDRQIAVNLRGTFHGLREASQRMRKGGRIVSVSSSVAALRAENYGIYAATKVGIEAMTASLAKELRGRDITVNAVAPGATGTDLFLNGKSAEAIAAFARLAPLNRIGSPEEIAAVIAFITGPEGGWINGQTIHANGGVV
ncbi:SDR family oxidoreductase [Rhizobium paknamense]|uniref:3-oxoacyl-[acyl-carrier protein] reductase n=1 Tax=Rhizobium paknamense TaxID=1206817 RepID=A0ABU0IF64_9HYPH|nr:SDR family oxidoreductase [Rhizobium paknamense]MDQ0456888.1 3-oxoacyl-[acyl-carrier protein] reductase [Rhizobium paknamense]